MCVVGKVTEWEGAKNFFLFSRLWLWHTKMLFAKYWKLDFILHDLLRRIGESGDSEKAMCTFPFIRGALSSYIAYYKPRQIDSSQALQDVLRILKIAAVHNVCNKNECDFLPPFNVSSRYRFFSLSVWVCHTKSLINSQMALSISLYRLKKIQFFMWVSNLKPHTRSGSKTSLIS